MLDLLKNQWSTNHISRESYDFVIRYDTNNPRIKILDFWFSNQERNWIMNHPNPTNKKWKPNQYQVLKSIVFESHREIYQVISNPNHMQNPGNLVQRIRITKQILIWYPFLPCLSTIESIFIWLAQISARIVLDFFGLWRTTS